MPAALALFSKSGYPPFLLTEGKFVLGRSSKCDFVVNDASVSRHHAEISLREASVFVSDLASRNGTYVNSKRVSRCQVTEDQEVRFGAVPFVLRQAVDAELVIDSEIPTESCAGAEAPAISKSPSALLSPAQRRVLDLLLAGLSEKQIAARLKISPHTVHNHVRALYQAFAVHSRSELLAQCLGDLGRGLPSK
jgi:DNA-binding CsgD family transcriptional regulator